MNTKDNNDVKDLLVRFDNPNVGKQLRKSRNLLHNDLTPISRIAFSYSLGNIRKEHAANAKVVQFPIKLAWAATVHKFQGQTIKPPATLVGHMESIFAKAQAYVLFGRVQSLSQLYLTSCTSKMIKVSEEALSEAQKLSDRAINNMPSLWHSHSSNQLKVVALNTRSLNKHLSDIRCDANLMIADFFSASRKPGQMIHMSIT